MHVSKVVNNMYFYGQWGYEIG